MTDRRRALNRALIGAWAVLCLGSCARTINTPAGSRNPAWKEAAANPIITMGRTIPYMLWNDPSVLKEGDGYRMWLSGGDPRNLQRIVVQVYSARSSDGLAWDIDPTPGLSPSEDPRQWDSLRIETPSVVKAEGVYHMYYSGSDEKNAKEAIYAIGHATSRDGTRWTRDPANPVITAHARDKYQWGTWGAVEPAAVYDARSRTFYLYYVSMRHSKAEPTIGHLGVLLAKSKDGSRFTHHVDKSGERALILTRNVENAIPGAWFGYSTPSVFIRGVDEFHLFCSFLVAPGGPHTARQVALAHAVGRGGTDFEVVEESLFEVGKGDWKDHQVSAPTVIDDDGVLKMWFAGQMREPHFGAGIGYATGRYP